MVSAIEPPIRDRIVASLKELELSTHEALTYVTLLIYPNTTASALCSETNIPDSKIYYALDSLSKKGIIIVQQGNPNLYKAVAPKEAIATLKQRLKDQLNEKMREADVLADTLTPMYETTEKPEELELAFIVRGKKSIINRMKSLIESSTKEITLYVHHSQIIEELHYNLIAAKKRRVKINLAVTKDAFENANLSEFSEVKLLCCTLDMFLSDMKTLVTVTSWNNETAIMTHDQNLMRVCRDYYDNPLCCAKPN